MNLAADTPNLRRSCKEIEMSVRSVRIEYLIYVKLSLFRGATHGIYASQHIIDDMQRAYPNNFYGIPETIAYSFSLNSPLGIKNHYFLITGFTRKQTPRPQDISPENRP